MDWKLAMETEQAALNRIVVLLFALADLAELSCGRSRAVRGFVLWLLLPAETLARALVTGSPAPILLRRAGNSPADAIRLAASLRSLAGACRDLSRLTLGCANEAGGLPGERTGVSIFNPALADAAWTALRVSRPPPCDTS